MTYKVLTPTMMALIIIQKDTIASLIMVQTKEEMLIHKWTIIDLDQQCKWEAC
jgi:hypothetical protein